MLERNRRELDSLSGGASLGHTPPASGSRTVPRIETPAPSPASPAPARTPAERALDDKLGPGWRYELVERIRAGGEMVVRCRITVPGRGATRTQYGAAPISGRAARVSGTAGGTRFGLGAGASPSAAGSAIQAEHNAEGQAIESALAACARLL